MSLYVPIVFEQIPGLLDRGVGESDIEYALKRVALKYTREIQRATPVDTGRLRASIRVELLLDGMGVAVTSEVFYAGFVEFGTRRMRPRSFVENLVPDLLSYGNALLGELGGEVRSGVVRSFVNNDAIYTGESVRSVSVSDFNRVKSLVVRSQTIQPAGVTIGYLSPESILDQITP